MSADLSSMSSADLLALSEGRMQDVSDQALKALAGYTGEPTAYQRGRDLSYTVPGRMAQSAFNVVQGPTFGFADELLGGLGALVPQDGKGFAQRYQEIRDFLRGAQADVQEDYPKSAGLGRISGAVAMGGPLAARLLSMGPAASTTAGKLGQAAASGATAGGIGAIGEAESPEDIPNRALWGMGLGGAGGLATQGAASGIGGVASNIAERMASSRLSKPFGLDQAARNEAEKLIARAVNRDMPSGVSPMSMPGMLQARADKLGEEARLVDVAPQGAVNTRQLLDTVANQPGRTAQQAETAIRQRHAGRANRMIEAALAFSPVGLRKYRDEASALIAGREAEAKPLYDQLRQMTIKADDELLAKIQSAMKLAGGNVRKIATAEDVPTSGFSQDAIPIRFLDTLKRALYAAETAPNATNAQTGKVNDVGRAIGNLRRDIVAKLDELTTDPKTGESLYKAARDAYAGPSEVLGAMDKGYRAMGSNEWRVKDITADLSASEIDAFRFGAFSALKDKLGTQSGQTQMMNMWREPATREKLQYLFGDQKAFREFASSVAAEARLRELQQVGRGSQTSGRESRKDSLAAETAVDLANAGAAVAKGSPTGILAAVKSLYGRATVPEPVRDEIGRLLLMSSGKDPTGFRYETVRLGGLIQELQRRSAEEAARTGLLGAGLTQPFAR